MIVANAPTAERGVVARVAHRVLWWLDPEEYAAGVIYGILLVGIVVAIEWANGNGSWRDIESEFGVLVLYWLIHTYAKVVGDQYASHERWSLASIGRALVHESAIVRGGIIPIFLMTFATFCGFADSTVTGLGLLTVVLLLIFFQGVAAHRAGMRGWILSAQVVVGLFFGACLVGLKYLMS